MPISELARDLDVLVVDDEPGILQLLLGYFSDRGFRVAGAADGRVAITSIQRAAGRLGLVVTDLNLPGADGFAVLQAARQANPRCYVVIITGHASLDSAIRAVRVGACDYLTKPFSMGQLDVVLSRVRDLHATAHHSDGRPPATVEVQPAAPAPPVACSSPVPAAAPAAPRRRATVTPPVALTPSEPEIIDGEVIDTDAAPDEGIVGSTHRRSIDARLNQLEAAFGRIEALLRERR